MVCGPVEPRPLCKLAAWEHMKMLSDRRRVEAFKSAIAKYRDSSKVFCELGCGTGVFAIAAASAFRKVVAVDSDPEILDVARWNAAKHGVADKIEFIQEDATTLTPDVISDEVDILLSETLSTWLLREPLIPILNNAWCRLLTKNSKVIPCQVTNIIELGYCSFDFDGIELRGIAPELAEISRPTISTLSVVAQEVAFDKPVSIEVAGEVSFSTLCDGPINFARISSVAHLAPGINISSRDTLMPALHVPLDNQIGLVSKESRVIAGWRGVFGGGLESFDIKASLTVS